MILKVAVSVLLLFSSLRVAQGAIDPCLEPPENIAVYEGDLNTLIYFPTSPNGVRWSTLPTTDERTEVTLVNYDDTVDPSYAADYDFNSTGLIIRNATTTADYSAGHQLSTAGLYTAAYVGWNQFSFKFLVVQQGPTCSCSVVNTSSVQLTCSATYADSTYAPVAAVFTLYVNGSCTTSDTPQRTSSTDGYGWISTSTFTIAYSSLSTYQCGLTFDQPTEIQDSSVARNAPTFNHYCSVTASEFGCTTDTTTSPSECPSLTTATTRLSTISTTQCHTTTTTNTPSTSISPTTTRLSTSPLSSSTATTATTTPSTTGFPISMEPLFGPVAGGTSITMTGPSPIDHPPSNSRSNIPDLGNAINVYIGSDLSAKAFTLLTDVSSTFGLVAVTPNTTEASIGQHLPVIIEFSSNISIFNMTCNKTFTFLPNPEIASLYPNSFIVNGGILLDVTGRHLSSVAKPIIQLTVVITRAAENSSTSYTTTRFCTVPPGNDTYMQCPMPPLSLPDDFLVIINSMYNTSAYRKRRNILKRYANVLTLTVPGANGDDRADIYLGFILDGYKRYENINDALPDTKFTFYSAPEINSSDELIQFDPSEDELIHVKGRHMMRGCLLRDYLVHIGNQTCINSDLQDNELSCRPPKVEPSITMNDTAYCHQHLSIRITVGYKQYQYACLTYTDHSKRLALIVGLTVGLGVFAILLTILVICIVRCRKSKVREETDIFQYTRGVELRNIHSQNAERPGSKRDLNIIHTRQNPMTIYKTDYDHEIVLQQESQQDYDQQIQEYDDYLQPNGDYLTAIEDE